MNRPKRQLQHLVEKVAAKTSRSLKQKVGKRVKRWKKWIEQYKPLTE